MVLFDLVLYYVRCDSTAPGLKVCDVCTSNCATNYALPVTTSSVVLCASTSMCGNNLSCAATEICRRDMSTMCGNNLSCAATEICRRDMLTEIYMRDDLLC